MTVCTHRAEDASLLKAIPVTIAYLLFAYLIVVMSHDSDRSSIHRNITGSVYYVEQLDQVPIHHYSIAVNSTSFLLPAFDQLASIVHSNEDHFKSTTIVTPGDQIKALSVAYYMAYHCVDLEIALNRFEWEPWQITDLQLQQLRYWSNTMICV